MFSNLKSLGSKKVSYGKQAQLKSYFWAFWAALVTKQLREPRFPSHRKHIFRFRCHKYAYYFPMCPEKLTQTFSALKNSGNASAVFRWCVYMIGFFSMLVHADSALAGCNLAHAWSWRMDNGHKPHSIGRYQTAPPAFTNLVPFPLCSSGIRKLQKLAGTLDNPSYKGGKCRTDLMAHHCYYYVYNRTRRPTFCRIDEKRFSIMMLQMCLCIAFYVAFLPPKGSQRSWLTSY